MTKVRRSLEEVMPKNHVAINHVMNPFDAGYTLIMERRTKNGESRNRLDIVMEER